MFLGTQRTVDGFRIRHATVSSLEAARFIFDAANKLNINWAEIDEGDVDKDPLDPANWEGN
jgi:hypothetical protein